MATLMRNIIFIATVLLLPPLSAQAQRFAHSGIGYSGGPQGTTWQSELTPYRPVIGVAAGLYAPIMMGNRIELQPELQLSYGGTASTLPEGERSSLRTLHANVPVNFKFFVSRTFNLQAGGQAGYLLMATTDRTDVRDLITPLDMGVTVGMGLGTWSGLDITLRYYNGLTGMLRDDAIYFPYNRTLQVTVGKRFVQFRHRRVRR